MKAERLYGSLVFRSILISLAVAAVTIAAYLCRLDFLDRLELGAEAARFRLRGLRPPSAEVAIVAVDAKSISAFGRWPWTRREMARLISSLAACGPRVIALDFSFPSPGPVPAHDASLVEALRSAGTVILGYCFFISSEEAAHQSRRDFLNAIETIQCSRVSGVVFDGGRTAELPLQAGFGVDGNDLSFSEAAAGCGFYNAFPEQDGSIRRAPLVVKSDGGTYFSFAVAAVRRYLGNPPAILSAETYGASGIRLGGVRIPMNPEGRTRINFCGPGNVFPTFSAADVVRGAVPLASLKGKIVVVGGTSISHFERRATPFSASSPSAEIQATIISTILTKDFLVDSPLTALIDLASIAGLSILLGFAVPSIGRAWLRIASPLLILGAYFGANLLLFSHANLCLSITYPALAVILTYLCVDVHAGLFHQARSARLREAFSALAATISTIPDSEPLLEKIADSLTALMGARRVLLLLRDGSAPPSGPGGGDKAPDDGFRIVVRRGGIPLSGGEFDFIRAVLHDVQRDGAGRIVPHARSAGRSCPASIGSLLAVPLICRGELTGLLYADNAPGDPRFHPPAVRILSSFAAQSASAIENARLYAQLKDAEARLVQENIYLRKEIAKEQRYALIVGDSRPMREVYRMIEKVTASDITVLLLGETGTGKNLIARTIHSMSARKDRPFVAQNCSALPETLLESELFGHVKGAFTGAARDKKGLFEIADDGTVFLDEIADTSEAMQSKLLHVIEDGTIRPVGATATRKVDVRIISATNKNLEEEVREGRFREDLFYRLNVFTITLPPLRERREDIPLLVQKLIEKFTASMRKAIAGISPEAMALLMNYGWPGNVRELQNEIEKAVAMTNEGGVIAPTALSEKCAGVSTGEVVVGREAARGTLQEVIEAVERKMIIDALTLHKGNKSQAAKGLGLSRSGLKKKLVRLGLQAMWPGT